MYPEVWSGAPLQLVWECALRKAHFSLRLIAALSSKRTSNIIQYMLAGPGVAVLPQVRAADVASGIACPWLAMCMRTGWYVDVMVLLQLF